MTQTAPTTLHGPAEPARTDPAEGSLLGSLRAQARDLATGKTIDIPIPGYRNPALIARYRFLPEAEAKEIGKRVRESDAYDNDLDRAEAGIITAMIEACEGLFARQGDKLEPVDPDGGGPCRYDGRLETFFGREPSQSARTAVLVAFKENWLAALNHGRLFQEWLGDTSKTIEQLLGEA
jgi:hypothetical protein